jgi:nucleotide-binding universal stress UspA family protein
MHQSERDTILVPTDFSDVSEFAIDHAVEIAKIFNHRICLLHVVSKRTPGTTRHMALQEKLQTQADAVSRRTRLSVSFLLEAGSIFTVISEVADRIPAEFIVMGIHGKKGVQHLVGSYAYKVVCSSNVPVMVVKHMHHHVGYKNIVVPIDFSRESTQKITQAILFAKYFNARVRVFGFLSSTNKAKIIKKEALLKNVTDVFKKQRIPVTTDLLVKPGIDWEFALMRFAGEMEADLIMIVAEKGSQIPEIFSSNSAEVIIDKADVPVLTFAPRNEDLAYPSGKKAMIRPFVDPLGLLDDKPPASDERNK